MRDLLARHGDRPGERSIGRVLRKAKAEGLVKRERVHRGGLLPSGRTSNHGTTTNVLVSRMERRKARAKARQRPQRPQRNPGLLRPPARAREDEQVSFDDWATSTGAEIPDTVRAMMRGLVRGPAPPRRR